MQTKSVPISCIAVSGTLTDLATSQGKTIEAYVEHIINKHLISHYKESVVQEVDLETLPRYKTAIDTVKAEIVAEKEAVKEEEKIEIPPVEDETEGTTTTEK